MKSLSRDRPSLEALIENEDLGFEILHPGGTGITQELADLCSVGAGSYVLDVACGTGESACYIAEQFRARLAGVDASAYMIARAQEKAKNKGLQIEFKEADALHLPFADDTFDAVISECTVCLLDKERAIHEMIRVTKPGGSIGFHDICWQNNPPDHLKNRLAEIEGEQPETLEGWKMLCERAGLVEVQAMDRSALIPPWMKESISRLNLAAMVRIVSRIAGKWGIQGLLDAWESERIFQSRYTGYGLLVGRKPWSRSPGR
ncbi:MAG: class I SAM-dependent methyltransferase [Bacteroidota bacterium]